MRRNFTILGLLMILMLNAQDLKVINGVVLNSKEQPIKDVRVTIVGQKPAYTDSLGQFTVNSATSQEKMTIVPLSHYKSKEIWYHGQDNMTIFLTDDDLDSRFDALRLPTGITQRGDIIASAKDLNTEDIHQRAYASIDQHLQGRVSGAYVTNNSGMPGTGASVYIRGYSSLLTNNQPLYVIDGIPLENANNYDEMLVGYNYNPLTSIDPNDITEVTVLKDAEATAIYGMKGANGVVCITTLEPKETKTTIDVMYRTGLTTKPSQTPVLNDNQYRSLANEVLFSSGMHLEEIREQYKGLYYTNKDDEFVDFSHNTNWQDEVYQNAMMQNLHFSIKGGDAIAKYGLSVGYLHNDGVVKNTSTDRVNIRLVGAFEVFSWLRMNMSSSLSTNNAQVKESGVSPVTSPILASLSKSPLLNPYEYDDDGKRLSTIAEVESFGVSNPTAIIDLFSGEAKSTRFTATVNFDGDITDHIKFTSLIGLNTNNLKEYTFIPNRGFDKLYNQEVDNASRAQNSNLKSTYNDNFIYYKNTFNKVHSIKAGLGLRWQKTTFNNGAGIAKNTPSDYYQNLNRGTLLPEIAANSRSWNWGSVYANVAYDYANKYLVNATVTGDFSSRVGSESPNTFAVSGQPIGNFYSVGAGWRISEEDFLSHADAVEEIKLRASYGVSGNDDIGSSNASAYYQEDQYRETTVLVPGSLTNRQLTYQEKQQLNIGVDVGLWANRLSFTADYFSNNSNNLLLYELKEVYYGNKYYPNNGASIATSGVELGAMWRAVNTSDFVLDCGFNLSKYNSIVTDIAKGNNTIDNYGQLQIINQKDEAVNSFYGYEFQGVYSSLADAQQANMYTDRGLMYERGDAIYENVNDDDNVINTNDKKVLGSFEPDFYGGMFVNAYYKGFSLKMLLQGTYGNEIYNYTRYYNERMVDLSNQSTKTLQRWQYDGHKTNVPKATYGDPKGNSAFSSRWIEDGSYLRLKELTLTYDIQKDLKGISNMQFFVTAHNLLTWTNYTGYDPEFSYSQDLVDQGVDYGLTPITKQFILGVKVGL